jgi:hypothetical protein
MRVKIYQPTKTAMQSGTGNTHKWCLEFDPENTRFIDPVMGWTGNTDTRQQLSLWFDTKERAIEHAKKESYNYRVTEPKKRKIIIKTYAGNFTAKPVV